MEEPFDQELQFPLVCNYRIIAEDLSGIDFVIETVLMEMGIRVPVQKGNQSSQGRYLTFHADIEVDSKEMMTRIDGELRAINGVKMVL
ncbi:MAG: DUF493 domain-containing protein [Candidatus Omnitrophica bacterium]|nr:DUF493 domain-containing protein [Candidatus Omnitrophota bacterium]